MSIPQRWVCVAVIAVALAGLAWGVIAGRQSVGERPAVRAAVADAAWYAALPADPVQATDAYLARVPAATRERAQAFSNAGQLALVLRLAVLVAATLLILDSGLAARMRTAAMRASRRTSAQDALFAVQFLGVLLLLGLPVEVFAGFVRWRAAGLSHASFGQWLGDYLTEWAVLLVFYVVGIVAIMALIRRRPASWPLWATGVYVALYALYAFVSPLYIEPLLNRFTPLPDGATKEAILSLARANGVPAANVYVKDASRQSVVLNAQVSGFAGTARITLDDNTIANTPADEVELVMAHEIGHYVLRHVFKETVLHGIVMGIGFLFIAWAMRGLVARYGARWEGHGPGDAATLPLFWLLVMLWGYVALPADNGIQREDEREADLFGLNASQRPLGLAEFMIRDADAHPLTPNAFVEWALYTHPAPANRIRAAMRWRAEHLPAHKARATFPRVP